MKTLAIGSLVVLFAIASMVTMPAAFADHSKATVITPEGSSVAGCEVTNECFIPSDVTIDVGGQVTWNNDDVAAHTVTSGAAETGGPDGIFDSGLALAGTTFSHTFEEAGEYPYFCIVHPWMVGTVTVTATGDSDDKMMDDGDKMMDDGKMMDDDRDKQMMDDHGHKDLGETSGVGMLSDGTEVKIYSAEPAAGEQLEIKVHFEDSEHANYDLMVTQNGNEVLNDVGAHEHEGTGVHMTAPLESGDAVDVTVTFQGFGIDEKTGPIGEQVVFSQVVPEFGTIAAMILAVAIVSIIAVTARSRLSLTPRI